MHIEVICADTTFETVHSMSPNFLDIASAQDLSELADELRGLSDNIGVTFLDQNQLPSI